MNFWDFYRRVVAMIRETSPEFPQFEQVVFIEALVEICDDQWHLMMPFVKHGRYEEWEATLTERDKLWQWLFRTLYHGGYGSGCPWGMTLFSTTKYVTSTPGVGAPVPAAHEILGGPNMFVAFTDDEHARLMRCVRVDRNRVVARAEGKLKPTRVH